MTTFIPLRGARVRHKPTARFGHAQHVDHDSGTATVFFGRTPFETCDLDTLEDGGPRGPSGLPGFEGGTRVRVGDGVVDAYGVDLSGKVGHVSESCPSPDSRVHVVFDDGEPSVWRVEISDLTPIYAEPPSTPSQRARRQILARRRGSWTCGCPRCIGARMGKGQACR